ncbi:hypothetical protein vseg_018549 [Gypsophila vaccaria]
MPKKLGVNSKAEEARTRKAQAEAEKKEKQAKDREEKYWQEAEGSKSKAAKKREEDEQKRAELAAKKAEVRRLAELEEREIEKALKKPDKKAARTAVPAVAKEAKKRQSRVADEGEYERIVLVENLNRDEAVIEAHSVDEAIAKIKIGESLPVDKHPEKRLKASFKAFEEAELPRLKADKPGLTHTQYKDMIWKLWKKSPDNPLNKVAE